MNVEGLLPRQVLKKKQESFDKPFLYSSYKAPFNHKYLNRRPEAILAQKFKSFNFCFKKVAAKHNKSVLKQTPLYEFHNFKRIGKKKSVKKTYTYKQT